MSKFYKMTAGEYQTLALGGKLPANSDPLPDGWDEAFLDCGETFYTEATGNSTYKEVWDCSRFRNEDGTIDFDIGPNGRTVRVPPHATVKVR